MSPGPIQLDQATALTLMLGPNGSVGIQASVESRLNRLSELSQAVDERLDGQLARQSELEAMRSSQDGLSSEVEDLKCCLSL